MAQPVQPEAYLEHAIDSLLLHEAEEDERVSTHWKKKEAGAEAMKD